MIIYNGEIKLILFDLSQLMWIGVHSSFNKQTPLTESDDSRNMLRTMLLNSIMFYKQKFKDCGEIVICCDSDTYWRRDFFPYYKGDRKRKREASHIDSRFVASFVKVFKRELIDNFKFKVVEVPGAEADDVIAILSKWSQTNDLNESMFDSEPKQVAIISEDMDFFQLSRYKNVKQFGPRKQKLLKPDVPLKEFVITHIVKASDDGIPNILSADNCLVDQIRQTSITKAYLDKFIKLGEAACETDQEKINWKRNQTLVDFNFIPPDLETKIIEAYISYEIKGNRMKIMNYLMKSKCGKKLLDKLGDF